MCEPRRATARMASRPGPFILRGSGAGNCLRRSRLRMTERDMIYVKPEDADVFVRALLLAHGLPAQDAATVASCLVSADLRGVDTHGICRLPGYLDRVRRGLINAKPALAPKRVTPVAASLDGQDAFGFVVGK